MMDSIDSKFACCIDGLKKIHRRIIWTLGVTDRKIKVLKLSGNVMEYHPHGDSAISDAIVKLSQPFNNIIPLVHALSSVGNFGGEAPSAPRYLDVISAPFTRDVFFHNTNTQALTLLPVGDGFEPKYFIPKIPMALLTGNFGMVPGFKSDAVAIGFKETCELTLEFIKARSSSIRYKEYYKKFCKYLIPDHPAYSSLRNHKILKEFYENKVFNPTLVADGILHITPNSITIRSLPFISDLCRDEEKIHTNRKLKGNWYDKHIQELCGGPDGELWGDIQFKLKRGVDPFSILDEFKKQVGFTRTWTPINTWLNQDSLMEENFTPFDIVDAWYNERFKYIRVELKHTQTKLIVEYRKLEALIIVVDNEALVHKIFRDADTVTDTIKPLCKKFQLTEFQAKYLASLTYAQITKQGKNELLKKKREVKHKIDKLQHEFISIDDRMIREVEEIQKKYTPLIKRKMQIPDHMGWVKIGTQGIVQYDTHEELMELVDTFGSDKVQIHEYPKNKFYKHLLKDGTVYTEGDVYMPKQLSGVNLCITKTKPTNIICYKKNTSYRLKIDNYTGCIPYKDTTYLPVGKQCLRIDKKGIVTIAPSSSFDLRKGADNIGIKDNLLYASPVINEQLIIIHGNKREKNCIRIEYVDVTKKNKITKLPIGKTEIMYVGSPTDKIVCSINHDVLYRCPVHHLVIDKPLELLGGKKLIRLELNKKKTNGDIKFKKFHKHPNIWTL